MCNLWPTTNYSVTLKAVAGSSSRSQQTEIFKSIMSRRNKEKTEIRSYWQNGAERILRNIVELLHFKCKYKSNTRETLEKVVCDIQRKRCFKISDYGYIC